MSGKTSAVLCRNYFHENFLDFLGNGKNDERSQPRLFNENMLKYGVIRKHNCNVKIFHKSYAHFQKLKELLKN